MKILHIALQYQSEKKADIFFRKILELNLLKKFTLEADFSQSVFKVKKGTQVIVFADENSYFEIFITDIKPKISFEHICISVEKINRLISRCKKFEIEVIQPVRNGKKYLFIRDFSGYIYEVKESDK